ncbi:MAG: hypothetical protein AB7T38_14815 [Nitrospirales bacterium]
MIFVTHSQGVGLGASFSTFKQFQEDSTRRESLPNEPVREGSGHATQVWFVANPVASKSHPLPSKGFRDPFAPIEKSIPVPKSPGQPKIANPPLPSLPLPGKLLSVIRGPWGYQAVIQLSPKEHLIVEPGETVAQTGWRVKEIKDDRVRLDWIQSRSHSGGSPTIKSANLFFK